MKRIKIMLLCFFSFFSCFPMITDRVLGDANWGTHMVPLITAIVNTEGPVLEMGCGDFSTPLLHAICAVKKRFLFTVESNKTWQNLFLDLIRQWHQFKHVTNWDDVGKEVHWSVVFIDHAPDDRRMVDVKRLRGKADIFVVHDTQGSHYPYLSTFKYRYEYKRYKIATMLVSDIIDVAAFFKDE